MAPVIGSKSLCSETTQNKSSAVAEMGDRLVTIGLRRKVGGAAVPLSTGGAGSPSNTMSPGPRSTSVPSDILIHPTVWPQYTNITNRTDRIDNGPVAQGEPLLVTIAKKRINCQDCDEGGFENTGRETKGPEIAGHKTETL